MEYLCVGFYEETNEIQYAVFIDETNILYFLQDKEESRRWEDNYPS